jgi:hypothetical protein
MAAGELARQQAVRSRIARVRRRLNLPVWLEASVAPAWVGVTAFVLWRVFVQRALPVVGLAALALVVAATVWRATSRRVSEAMAAVVADRQSGLGGLLLTRLEVPVGGWEFDVNARLKTLPLPAVDLRKPLAWLVGVLAFLVVGLLVPQTERPVRGQNAAAATRVDALADKLEALAQEEPSDLAAQEELARLQEEVADGTFDAADWEAADSLDKALDDKAQQAAAELARAEAAAAALSEAVARAQTNEATAREREDLERALTELEASAGANDAPSESQNDPRGEPGPQADNAQPGQEPSAQTGQPQPGETQQGPSAQRSPRPGRPSKQAGSMSGQQAADLRRTLEQRRQQLSRAFGQGSSTGGPQQQGQGGGRGRGLRIPGLGSGGAPEELDPSKSGHLSHQVDPNGGPSRGGGASPLKFGKDAEMDPERLQFEPLPQGQGGEAGELYGLRAATPTTKRNPVSAGTGTGAAAGAQAPGPGAAPMLPKNRALIERYFDSKR